MKKLKVVNENEVRKLENGEWAIINTTYQWYGYKQEKYVILVNAKGKFIIAKIYNNCISIGSGIVAEFDTFKEALEKAEKIIETL